MPPFLSSFNFLYKPKYFPPFLLNNSTPFGSSSFLVYIPFNLFPSLSKTSAGGILDIILA